MVSPSFNSQTLIRTISTGLNGKEGGHLFWIWLYIYTLPRPDTVRPWWYLIIMSVSGGNPLWIALALFE